MHCASCINHISALLDRICVIEVDIDIAKQFARIRFDDDLSFANQIIDTIEDGGYIAKKLSIVDDAYNLLD
ncbi:heavy-metal-associated domain-containing protein [Liberiplasma polymorphum]|uniref:heavy-metal-associated domain-containing protein n=1 Tax=Liberiplasma polymorphum TaxID=3374570 RepID=UPI003775882A